MTKNRLPPAPKHLSSRAKKHWKKVHQDYEIEGYAVDLLLNACEQLNRADAAAAEIEADGLVVTDRFGQKKAHPMIDVERNAHLAFLRISRELGLDIDVPETRGPRRAGTR